MLACPREGKYDLWVCPCFSSNVPCLVCLSCKVFEIGGKWHYICCFVGCYFQDLFNIDCSIFVLFPSSFFFVCLVSIHLVHLHSSIDITTGWKKSHFILWDRSDFHMIDSLSITVYAFAKHILTSLSVDETLLLRYVNLSTNLRGSPFRV